MSILAPLSEACSTMMSNDYTNGHESHSDVFSNGNTNGHSDIFSNGNPNGHSDVFSNGNPNGHSDVFSNGNTDGHTNGMTNGYTNGHSNATVRPIESPTANQVPIAVCGMGMR